MNSATNTASDETKPAKRKHVRKRKRRNGRRVQITESTARIAQVARERGIFAIVTMSTRELSAAMFSDGRDHRKVAGRARKELMDEHRKRAADNLKRGELLATALRAEPKQPETEPIEQQPKLGTQLDTGRK